MLRVGLTGGIGSGKSTIGRILQVLGVPVFNADDEAKRILNEDRDVRQAVGSAFGEALYASGDLDRKALSAIVFHDEQALQKLNAIVHPAVRRRFNTWCMEQRGAAYVVMEAAILAETGGAAAMDHLAVVTAPADLRIKRVMARDQVSENEVRARMRNQTDDAARIAKADTVIVNDDRTLVIPQVLALHERLGGRSAAPGIRDLPLSMVTFFFGSLSIPLAFTRHLVSLASIMAVLAIAFHLWGRRKMQKKVYTAPSLKRSRIGWWAGLAGLICAIVMWILWSTNVLLEH